MIYKILTILLLTGLLSACGGQPTEVPIPSPTEESIAATQAPTNMPPSTDTAMPADTETPTDAPIVSSGEVSFSNDILPIIQSRCLTCHGGDRGAEEGLDMNSYANLMAGSENGPVVLAGDADGSLMVEMLIQNKMPKRGPKLTPPQIQLINDWINQDALNN
jgi:hypothetical protein